MSGTRCRIQLFRRIRVRDEDASENERPGGIFMLEEAKLILVATLDTSNHLISVETRGALRGP